MKPQKTKQLQLKVKKVAPTQVREQESDLQVAEWRVRTDLLMAIRLLHLTVSNNAGMLVRWVESHPNGVRSKDMAKIPPGCTLKTETLAKIVEEVVEFLSKQPPAKTKTWEILAGVHCDRGKRAIADYKDYLLRREAYFVEVRDCEQGSADI